MKRGRRQKRSAKGIPTGGGNREGPAAWWKRFQVPGICILLAMLTLFVFLQTRRFEFVNYDDDKNVYENLIVAAGLSRSGIAWAFTHSQVGLWIPLTTMSHMLDCQFHGLNAGPHHLTNVLLHTVSAILLFLVLRRMTGTLWPGAFVAAVFAIHPLRAESVAWVTERKDVLSGLFFMLTIAAYVRYTQNPWSLGRYMTVTILFVLGLLSKSMLVTLPFVLLLLDYWPLKRLWQSAETPRPESPRPNNGTPVSLGVLYEKMPLLALSVAASVVTLFTEKGGITPFDQLSLFQRIGNALVSYVTYIWQMLCPTGLAVLYPHPMGGLPIWEVIGAAVLLATISAVFIALRRKQPWLLVGWLWYLGMLVPVIGIIQSGELARADRYTYLPQIGLYFLVAWAVADWCRFHRNRRWLTGIVAIIVVTVLAVCSRSQTKTWRNSESLWTQALSCTSDNATAHNNLGLALAERGQIDDAIDHYRTALLIKPSYADAHINFGNALLERGQIDEAVGHYRTALEINPEDAEANFNLGNAFFERGNLDEAIAQFRKTLTINPAKWKAHNNLGNALARRGQTDEAISEFRRTLELNPKEAKAHNNLGNALLAQGQIEEAIAHYQKALEIEPGYTNARQNLKVALSRRERIPKLPP